MSPQQRRQSQCIDLNGAHDDFGLVFDTENARKILMQDNDEVSKQSNYAVQRFGVLSVDLQAIKL